MYIDDSLLSFDEDLSLRLRALYRAAGYTRYRMGKFEEYDLYAQFRDFLVSESIISFTDTNGKLMALKPDVTLFYAANNKVASGEVGRICYNENVYRISKASGSFKEIMQVGVECLGAISEADVNEVLVLAAKSLQVISPENVMAISSLDVLSEALGDLRLEGPLRETAQRLIAERNSHELEALLSRTSAPEAAAEKALFLLRAPEDTGRCIEGLRALGFAAPAIDALAGATDALAEAGFAACTRIDFSLVNDTAYYNGLAFQGFVRGVPRAVLMGGQYDNLLQKLGRDQRAVGFAVYTDGIRSAL